MKKLLKSRLFFFVLGAIIFSGATTVALSVIASDVAYDNTQSGSTATTMQGAIDDLYDKAENMPKGVKVVTLGTGTSYNIKNLYPDVDYTKLTTANFYYRISTANTSKITNDEKYARQWQGGFTAPSISYNAETGVLTCGNGTAWVQTWWYIDGSSIGKPTATATTTCYMVYAE